MCTHARHYIPRYMPTACRRSFIHAMALLRYFSPSLPKKVSSLTENEVKEVNAGVAQAQEEAETVASGRGASTTRTQRKKERGSGSMRLNTVQQRLYATVLNSLADRFQTTVRRLRFRSYARTHACAYKQVFAKLKSAKLAENPKIAQPPNIIFHAIRYTIHKSNAWVFSIL